jgi:hypothetical protein
VLLGVRASLVASQELDPNSVVDEARRREALQRQHGELLHELDIERKELGSVHGLIKVWQGTDHPLSLRL